MNALLKITPRVIDVLLVDVVRQIQLSPTNHALATKRFRTIGAWLEREGSPLRGLVDLLYPQGSMAICATISAKLDNDEFDIDIMVQLSALLRELGPCAVLDLLFLAVNGEPGSFNHGKVIRRTRCITVPYAGMHLDLTPAIFIPGTAPRTSTIFHAKLERPRHEDRRIIANPWGMAEWFMEVTPVAPDRWDTLAKAAQTEPVPDQPNLFERSLPLMALQLLKRWRNKRYDGREGRRLPSVLLTCLVGEESERALTAGRVRTSLYDELMAQTAAMLGEFGHLQAQRQLIRRTNPRCEADIITDRWPVTPAAQDVFVRDLRDLHAKLVRFGGPIGLDEKQEILSDLFGERAALHALEELRKRIGVDAGSSGVLHAPRSAAILSGGLAGSTAAARAQAIQAPRHTSFGGARSDPRWRS